MQLLYYRRMPLLAMYYELFESCYMGKQAGTKNDLLKDPFHVNRMHQLLSWLDDLETEWKVTGFMEEAWENDTMLVVTWFDTTMSIRQELLLQLAFSKTFSCDDPVITELYRQYVDIMTDDPSVSIAVKLSETKLRTAVTLYRDLVHASIGDFGRFVLMDFCQKEFPLENRVLRGGCFSFLGMKTDWYSEEIALIRETMNE